MAAANYQQTEDQFLCSICLEVFTDPVSTSCGHNFCKTCITENWNNKDQYECPICKETFSTKPKLRINTLLSGMVVQFRQSAQQKSSSSRSELKPGEVPCDVCTGSRLKALKSCLVCLTSFCQTHLEPHLTASALKTHQLIDPVENLEGRMCTKHDKPLELFCKTDQTCVCMLCSDLDHKTHKFVPLEEEYEDKKAELEETETELQLMIKKRKLKVQEIKRSVQLSDKSADRQKAEGIQVFTALKERVERGLNELVKTIEEKKRTTQKQAEGFIKELQQEICELKKRRTEVEQLSLSEDHLHVLQGIQTLNTQHPAPTKDWTQVSVTPAFEETMRRAVSQLEETLSKEFKKLDDKADLKRNQTLNTQHPPPTKVWTQVRATPETWMETQRRSLSKKKGLLSGKNLDLKRIQKYEIDVTLDPKTANPYLVLSDDGKQVSHSDVKKKLLNYPERFSFYYCVLAKQSFSSGRFYYEVQVQGKTCWVLGVVRESINRKEYNPWTPKNGFWTIRLSNGNEYYANVDPRVRVFLLSGPQKVGVFVDYDEGLVSFYDVDTAALIYSFTGCSFTEKLFPFFWPGTNDDGISSSPLIISPVRVQGPSHPPRSRVKSRAPRW